MASGDMGQVLEHYQQIGIGSNLAGYVRNEIHTDWRVEIVLDRNGLLFPELRQALDEYRVDSEAQGPVSESAFAITLVLLGQTPFP